MAVYPSKDFGDVATSCNGLTALPVAELAGLIWVTLDPKAADNASIAGSNG